VIRRVTPGAVSPTTLARSVSLVASEKVFVATRGTVDNGPMTAAKRRYPRVSFQHTGTIELRVPTGPRTSSLVKVPVAVKTISCEGTGLCVAQPSMRFERGASLRVFLPINEHRFEIPGRIAWVAAPSSTGAVDLGIRFQLELTENVTRQAYARWIVELITRDQQQQRATAR
jgi:hypothetical protein